MSKRAPKGRVKNPCRICNQTVAHKSGVQCKGACARWAHYKCLGYSPQKILDIRDGVIKITCPCPHCNPKVPVEEVVKPGRTTCEFFPDKPLGDVPCPPNAPCQSPRKLSPGQSPRKASPCQSSKKPSPCQSPGESSSQSPTGQPSPSDLKDLPPCPGPPSRKTSPCPPIPTMVGTQCNATGKQSPCPVDRPCQPAPRTTSPHQLPPRKQYLYQRFIRKQTACQPIDGKPPCQEPGELEAPCQPTEEASMFQRTSPKRSCIKPKDDFDFNPTSFEPQLFQPSAFKPKPPPCDPLCIPPPKVAPPCDEPKCRAPVPKCPAPVPCSPSPSCSPPPPKQEPYKNYKDCKTPPLSRTPSEISLVSPRVSPKQSKEKCAISFKTPSTNSSISSKVSFTKNDQHNKPISPQLSFTKSPQSASPSSRPPCDKSAPCQAPPPDTSLSCCKKCKNCKCSSNLSLLKSNCVSPICPKNVLAKPVPKAPPPSLAPCAQKTMRLCMDCTSSICPQRDVPTPPPKFGVACSEKKPCENCTSSICPNQKPNLRSVETCTEKKSKSCACLTVLRNSRIRSAVSESRMTNTCQTMLFSAIDQLCTTVGQLSGQIKMLMSKMRISG